MVKYETEGNTTTITNTAVLDITLIKRWFMMGTAAENIPDSAHLILLGRGSSKLHDAAEKAGVPFVGQYLPVYLADTFLLSGGTYISGDGMEFTIL